MNDRPRCTHCGQFISWGKAHERFIPETEFSCEDIWFLCNKCHLVDQKIWSGKKNEWGKPYER